MCFLITPKMNVVIITAVFFNMAFYLAAKAETLIEQNNPPVIKQIPATAALRGQPIPVTASVTDSTGDIISVSLFYALSQQETPVEVAMKKATGDQYAGVIPANFFGQSSKVWYYIEARDSLEGVGETGWTPVLISDPEKSKAKEEKADQPGISKKTWLIGGAVVAGGAIALAAGGGGGGGGDSDDNVTDQPGAIVVDTSTTGNNQPAPNALEEAIDITSRLDGRQVTGMNIILNYNPKTQSADQFEVVYNGAVVADSGIVQGPGVIQTQRNGTSPVVIIRVTSTFPNSVAAIPAEWEWSARVEFSVE